MVNLSCRTWLRAVLAAIPTGQGSRYGALGIDVPTKIPRRATHLVNDVSLHVGVVILHVLYASVHMAVAMATPYSGNLASYTYYTMTCTTSTRASAAMLYVFWGSYRNK